MAGAAGVHVAMALYGDVTYDSRVRREAASLARAGYRITIVCLAGATSAPDLPDGVTIVVRRPRGAAVIPGSDNPFFRPRRGRLAALRARAGWLFAYVRGVRSWGRLAVAAVEPADVWHAHDLTALAAIVPNLDRAVPVVYDSHELFLETGTALRLPGPGRRLLAWYEGRLVKRARLVVTVNEALASVLRSRYPGTPVHAVHNCPEGWDPPAEPPTVVRDAASIPAAAAVVLYHGALSVNRGIEQLMEALLEPVLQRAHLVLMGSGELRDQLEVRSREARWGGRVHVLAPVPPGELLGWVASADVGAMPLQPATLNLRLSTPNKLFECLAAGTPVVVSDFPGMRQIVLGDPAGALGAVCDPVRPESIAEAVGSILRLDPDQGAILRTRCRTAAAERWNWGHEGGRLLSVYDKILGP